MQNLNVQFNSKKRNDVFTEKMFLTVYPFSPQRHRRVVSHFINGRNKGFTKISFHLLYIEMKWHFIFSFIL
jgi:hypothetical protein